MGAFGPRLVSPAVDKPSAPPPRRRTTVTDWVIDASPRNGRLSNRGRSGGEKSIAETVGYRGLDRVGLQN